MIPPKIINIDKVDENISIYFYFEKCHTLEIFSAR